MIPVRTASSNFVYRGPSPDIGDAWVRRERGHQVFMVWEPSDEKRAAIAAGANIELGIYMEPIPPVSLATTRELLESIAAHVFEPGVCSACGCTDDRACDDGCYWTNDDETLCSNCVGETAA